MPSSSTSPDGAGMTATAASLAMALGVDPARRPRPRLEFDEHAVGLVQSDYDGVVVADEGELVDQLAHVVLADEPRHVAPGGPEQQFERAAIVGDRRVEFTSPGLEERADALVVVDSDRLPRSCR